MRLFGKQKVFFKVYPEAQVAIAQLELHVRALLV
jgi:hypothetical protein